jgi:hypothetical protein
MRRKPEGASKLYDFDEVRRGAAALEGLRMAVGVVNPRPPGWRNHLIQVVKKLLARVLNWYTQPLYEFNVSVGRSLEEVVWAVEHMIMNLVSLDHRSLNLALERLSVDIVDLEGQLAQLEKRSATVAEPMHDRLALLHRQVTMLVDLQKSSGLYLDADAGMLRYGMQWQGAEWKDRTAYIIGLFGTGRRYINELILENIGARAKYFRDTIRLHPGPTPMIYSGHVTMKYVSRAQESPAIMRYIQESVRSKFADLIFIYRHPLDSLLTNWIWWRTYIRDNRVISGIAEVYSNTDDLSADLEKNFLEFNSFAAGDPAFFAASPGPRFLSFSEFVEETELQQKSATLSLRLEDFMIDPVKEFSKLLKVISADVDLSQSTLAPPRAKPYGYLALKQKVPQFRDFIDNLDAETKRRIETIGYRVS